MKKQDWILIGGLLVLALAVFFVSFALRGQAGRGEAVVTIDGREFGRYPLNEDRKIELPTGNCLEVQDGKIRMIDADCPDRLCVSMPAISRSGETIICLPHKVVVSIEDAPQGDFDATAR